MELQPTAVRPSRIDNRDSGQRRNVEFFASREGRLWSTEEAAEILHVGRSTIYLLMADGRLPYQQATLRTRLISDRDIQQYLDSCKLSQRSGWIRRGKKAS